MSDHIYFLLMLLKWVCGHMLVFGDNKQVVMELGCNKMSRDVRKPDFCICENKDADQLRGDREADQHLCFRHLDITIPLLSESEISSL